MPIRPENKARYPPDWPEISRARKEFAGWQCECTGWCGSTAAGHIADDGRCSNRHGEPAYLTGAKVVLTGAHLDHQPENNDSVRALCQRCHLAHDREHHAQTRRATRAARMERRKAAHAMSIKILTKPLVALLGDLILTADQAADAGALGSVMLYTARGGYGGEPGQNDLLCGISTNRATMGYSYEPCTGQLTRPTLWPVRDIKSVLQVFKPLAAKDENHGVTIDVEGPMILVREDPAQPSLPFEGDPGDEPKGRELRFAQNRFEDYAGPGVFRLLELQEPPKGKPRRKDKVEWHPLPRTDLLGDRLAPFAKIAARRGVAVRLFREHQERRVLVQIGESYRGALRPHDYDPDGDERAPTVEVHTPDLLVLADMTGVRKSDDPTLDLKTASGLLFSEQKDEPAGDGPAPAIPGQSEELPLDAAAAAADDIGDEHDPAGDDPDE